MILGETSEVKKPGSLPFAVYRWQDNQGSPARIPNLKSSKLKSPELCAKLNLRWGDVSPFIILCAERM